MSATNVTTYYEFPVFVGSDKPAWLVDWNGAMNAIDSAIHEAKTEADANATNIASLQSSVTSLSGSVESQGSSITSLTQSLTSLQGTVNTITSLIGNGLPTTDDKTIIGAINELKAEIDALDPSGEGVQAENVSYDNTDSDLSATNVQDAIDEVNAKIPQSGSVDADNVTYDNTDSGLTATNVQDAIDELAQGGGSGTVTTLASVTATDSSVVVPDLNGFKFIQICTTNAGHTEIDGATIVPISIFKTITGIEGVRASYSTTYASMHYVDDTHISIDHVASGEGAVVYAW